MRTAVYSGLLNVQGDHFMNTNCNKIAISIGVLAASGLLSFAVPAGISQAIVWKPPMPCIAVDAGLYPVGAGLCHGTTGGLDSHKFEPELREGRGQQALGRAIDTLNQGGRS